MQQIITFLLQNKHRLFFLLLLFIGLILTINAHRYHKSKFIHAANYVTGGVYDWSNQFNEYFNLKEYNERLLHENARLRKELSNYKISNSQVYPEIEPYELIPATVIENSFTKKKNYLVINRGRKHGVKPDMGVITMDGVVGITINVNENYAIVLSALHTESRISAQLAKTRQLGSLRWNGNKTNIVQLEDINTVSKVSRGDTIVTGNYSIFPEGIQIGTIQKASVQATNNHYDIDVELSNDMTNIGYVYVVKNTSKNEIQELLNQHPNE